MSETDRDDGGRFTERVTEQEILKVFDRIEAPFLTAKELAEEIGISRQAANYRLKQMRESDLVDSKKTGARSVGWWAEVAPELSDEARRRADAADQNKAVSLEDLEAEFDGESA